MASEGRSDLEKAYSACLGMTDCAAFSACVSGVMQGSGTGSGGSAAGGTGGSATGGLGTGGGAGGSAAGGSAAGGNAGSSGGGSAGSSGGGSAGSTVDGSGGSGGRGGGTTAGGSGGASGGSAGTGGSATAAPELIDFRPERLLDDGAGDEGDERNGRPERRQEHHVSALGRVRWMLQRDGMGCPLGRQRRSGDECDEAPLRPERGRQLRLWTAPDGRQRLRHELVHARRRDDRRLHDGQLLHRPRPAEADPLHQGGPAGQARSPSLGEPVGRSRLDDGRQLEHEERRADARRPRSLHGPVRRGVRESRVSRSGRFTPRTSPATPGSTGHNRSSSPS